MQVTSLYGAGIHEKNYPPPTALDREVHSVTSATKKRKLWTALIENAYLELTN